MTKDRSARWERVLGESPLATVIVDRELNVELWNRAAERLFGWRAEEVLGKPQRDILPPNSETESAELQRRIWAGDIVEGFETIRVHRDGSPIDVAIYAAAFGETLGGGIAVRFVDIRERRKAEALARDEANRQNLLAGFLSASTDARDQTELLELLSRRASEALAGTCSVYRLTTDGNELEVVALAGYEASVVDNLRQMFMRQRWRADEGTMGRTLQTGETVFRPYMDADDRAAYLASLPEDRRGEMAEIDLRAIVTVPLTVEGTRIGVLALARYGESATPFEERDRAFAEALADRADIALARLVLAAQREREARQNRILAEFLEGVTEANGDESTILQRLAEAAATQMGDCCFIKLLTPDRLTLELRAVSARDKTLATSLSEAPPRRIPSDDPMDLETVLGGRSLLGPVDRNVAGASANPGLGDSAGHDFATYLAVPLRLRGHVVGDILLFREAASRPYEDSDLLFVEDMARRAALALERHRAEQAQHETLARFDAVLSASPIALALLDPDFRVRVWNPAAEALFGWTEREAYGKKTPLVPPDLQDEAAELRRNALAGQTMIDFETRRLRKDGAQIPVALFAAPYRTAEDELAGVVIGFVDLTERKRVERLAGRDAGHKQLMAQFLENATRAGDDEAAVLDALARGAAGLGGSCWVSLLDPDREFANIAAYHWTDPEQLAAARPYIDGVPVPANEAALGEVLRTGKAVYLPAILILSEVPFLKPEHRPFYERFGLYGMISTPLWLRGEIVGAITIAQVYPDSAPFDELDLAFMESLAGAASLLVDSARTRAARDAASAELQTTSATLQTILDSSPVAIWAVDDRLRVVYWNPAAERLYGWSAAEVRGQAPPFALVDDSLTVEADFEQVRNGQTVEGETRRMTRTGQTIDVRLLNSPIYDELGRFRGALAIHEDITERKRLEAELLQAQKMEVVGRLAGGVAHDFNNILTAIIGYSDIAHSMTAEPEMKRVLDTVSAAAQRAAGLTQQLLAFSRRQMLQPKVMDANDVVLEMEPILQRLIGDDIELAASVTPAVGSVLVDRTQLEQVILNLAVNARDAMPDGGRLVIRTEPAHFDADQGHLEMAPGDYVVISVTDSGVGMDDETKSHIFEPFFTTKEVGKGTGLGLATTYGIVRQSGGYVWVYSEPGQGTTFKLYFPRVGSPNALVAPVLEGSTARRGGRVLLVEDEPTLRDLALTVLSHSGFEVLSARDPAAAMKLAGETGHLDLLVTDVVMPGSTGIELAKRLQETRPGLPVLFMSGYSEDVTDVAGSMARRFLAKPFTPDELLRAVDEAIETDQKV